MRSTLAPERQEQPSLSTCSFAKKDFGSHLCIIYCSISDFSWGAIDYLDRTAMYLLISHRVGAGLRDYGFEAVIVGETRPYMDIVQPAIYHW